MCRSKRVRCLMFMQLVVASFCLFSMPEVSRADDFEAGRAAANRGEFATAYSLWQPLAERGDARAQLALGKMFARGDGVAKDFQIARRYFGSAAAQNNPAAQLNLGKMLYYGDGGPRDYSEAYTWFEQAAKAGVPEAREFLSRLRSRGVTPRPVAASSRQVASSSSAQQTSAVVESASSSLASPQVEASSVSVAASSSSLASDPVASDPVASDPLAPYRSTVARAGGATTARSFRFDPIAEDIIRGFPGGLEIIPTYDSSLFKGALVSDERELATHLSLAEGGNPESQMIMGFAAQYAGNKETARDWFAKASAQNNPQGLFALANLESENNYERAFKLYEQAADGGVVAARRNMGYLLLRGMGVDQNKDRGRMLLEQASKAGDALATDLLK